MKNHIVIKNATVYNSDYTKKTRCNITVEDGRIKKIEEYNPDAVTKSENEIDLEGKLILPGFIDSHLHIPGNILYNDYGVNLIDCEGIEDYIKKLKEFDHTKYKVIRGFGWNESEFEDNPEYAKKFKETLDLIFKDKPVVIYSTDFHSCFCNSKALEICGINNNTISPSGGEIQKDSQGNITGIIREQATKLISRKNDELGFSRQEMKQAILKYQEKLLGYGITAVNTLMFIGGDYKTEWDILKELEEEGKLKIKINGSIPASPQDRPEEIIKQLKKMQEYNSEKIRINTVKIYIDGVIDTNTAFLKEPYEETNYCGYSLWQDEQLEKMVQILDANNVQIHVHSIGDAASKQIVRALEKAIQVNNTVGEKSNRHTITHMQLIDNSDIEKMANNGIIAALQPFWYPTQRNGIEIDYEKLGEKRVNEQYKCNTMVEKGVCITLSSDSPVTEDFNPILGIYYGANRFNEKERASVPELIIAYTKNGAYQLKREDEIGEIMVGKRADFVVLEDIVNIDPKNIKDVNSYMCFIDGEIVLNRSHKKETKKEDLKTSEEEGR